MSFEVTDQLFKHLTDREAEQLERVVEHFVSTGDLVTGMQHPTFEIWLRASNGAYTRESNNTAYRAFFIPHLALSLIKRLRAEKEIASA